MARLTQDQINALMATEQSYLSSQGVTRYEEDGDISYRNEDGERVRFGDDLNNLIANMTQQNMQRAGVIDTSFLQSAQESGKLKQLGFDSSESYLKYLYGGGEQVGSNFLLPDTQDFLNPQYVNTPLLYSEGDKNFFKKFLGGAALLTGAGFGLNSLMTASAATTGAGAATTAGAGAAYGGEIAGAAFGTEVLGTGAATTAGASAAGSGLLSSIFGETVGSALGTVGSAVSTIFDVGAKVAPVVGAITNVAGTVAQIQAGKDQSDALKSQAAAQQDQAAALREQYAISKKLADIQNIRAIRQQLRERYRAGGALTARGAVGGTLGSSGYAGGMSSLGAQLSSNLSYMSDTAGLQAQSAAQSAAIGQAKAAYGAAAGDAAAAQGRASMGAAFATLGGTIFSKAGGFQSIFKSIG